MADESFADQDVTCTHCEAKQRVRVGPLGHGKGFIGPDPQKIKCIECGEDFYPPVHGKIVDGPFPIAESAGG